MTSSVLNLYQTTEELNKVYRQNYYDYLHSQEFKTTFHKVIADYINSNNLSCLDVGCGEGWLADLIKTPYTGIDGSEVAIQRATTLYQGLFRVGRIEDPPTDIKCDLVIFGNLFQVVISKVQRIPFIRSYLKTTGAKQFLVFDLEAVDLSGLDNYYNLVLEYHASVDVPTLQEIKRHRQIKVYSCH